MVSTHVLEFSFVDGYNVREESAASIFSVGDGRGNFARNIGTSRPKYKVSYSNREECHAAWISCIIPAYTSLNI
jgi:hypothetical protein